MPPNSAPAYHARAATPPLATPDAVRSEVEFAYAATALVREKLDAAGIRPSELQTWDALRLIPPTTRAEYRARFPADVVAGTASLAEPFVVYSRSSGTDMDRQTSVAHSFDLARRMFDALTVNPELASVLRRKEGNRGVRLHAPNCSDVECSSPTITLEDRILPSGELVLPAMHDLMATPPDMLDRAIGEIQMWSPAYLSCDAERLAQLLRRCEELGIAELPGDALLLEYTQITEHARAQAEAFFAGLPIASTISMSEVGLVAVECPKGALHLNAASFWAELVTDGRPTRAGECGELYVTTIGDRLAPRIRYMTGDVYRLLDPCACGHEFPAVAFEGRRRDLVRLDGLVALTPRTADAVVGTPPGLRHYRLQQVGDRFATFHYVAEGGPDAGWEARLREDLARRLPGCRLDVEAAGYIPSERSGKFLACTSAFSAELERRAPGRETLTEAAA